MTRRMPHHRSRPASRPLAFLAATLLAVASAGCTMCPDPFDYAGPVPNGSAPQTDFSARSNGILPLHASPKPWPTIVDQDELPTPAEPLEPEEPQVAEVPRSVLVPQASAADAAVIAEAPAESTDERVTR